MLILPDIVLLIFDKTAMFLCRALTNRDMSHFPSISAREKPSACLNCTVIAMFYLSSAVFSDQIQTIFVQEMCVLLFDVLALKNAQ